MPDQVSQRVVGVLHLIWGYMGGGDSVWVMGWNGGIGYTLGVLRCYGTGFILIYVCLLICGVLSVKRRRIIWLKVDLASNASFHTLNLFLLSV